VNPPRFARRGLSEKMKKRIHRWIFQPSEQALNYATHHRADGNRDSELLFVGTLNNNFVIGISR
jgi:hypothetical protein